MKITLELPDPLFRRAKATECGNWTKPWSEVLIGSSIGCSTVFRGVGSSATTTNAGKAIIAMRADARSVTYL